MRARVVASPAFGLIFAAAIAVLVGFGLFALLRATQSTWLTARPATCLSTHCFCESLHSGVPRQPASAWSSIAYIFAGVLLAFSAVRQLLRISEIRLVKTLALLLLIIGLGSSFYSATLTFTGQFFDIFGMYLLGTFILAAALVQLKVLNASQAIPLYVFANAGLAVLQYSHPDVRRYLFAGLLIPGIALEFLPRMSSVPVTRRWPLQVGLATTAVAYVFWLLDQDLVLCSPHSLLQGHALWHIMTAAAVILLAMHYTQTRRAPRPAANYGPAS